MIGLLGGRPIAFDVHAGPTAESETHTARLARHEVVRGAPILQDLGNDAGARSLEFFWDETFCDPEDELRRLRTAFEARAPLELFLDLRGFQLRSYVIETLTVEHAKRSPSGRTVRMDVSAELVTAAAGLGLLGGIASTVARALASPLVRR